MSDIYGFRKKVAKKLRDSVQSAGDSLVGFDGVPEQRRVAIILTPVGGIPAASGATPGTATITLCKIDGTNGIVTTSITETGYNVDCTSIPASSYMAAEREYIGGAWIVIPPPITDLRLDGSNFQYKRGCTWTTWTTGTSCP